MAEDNAPPTNTEAVADDSVQQDPQRPVFPVVGVGASAGGLAALQVLFKALPADTGMAYVVVVHLAPDHESNLAQILARDTTMPVATAIHEAVVEPNHVYVIPPARDIVISGGRLQLIPQRRSAGLHAIDYFFRSLAEDAGHLAVGVVLSGGLNDGTVGLEEIKAASGVSFAQDESAEHESMPKSAIASGCVDYVLPPEGIAQELVRFARHPYLVQDESVSVDEEPGHARVTEIIRRATGVDFTHYKSSTLQRRIRRRMMLNRHATAADYEEFLRRTPEEVEELYQDILIGVTSFFRNPDAFEALSRDVFPKLISECPKGEKVRLWVVGCSSGEEAYSLAMTFTECAEALGSDVQFQLFATDVNQRCVEKARAAWYPRTIAHDVSPERLKQFFVEEGGGYRIHKALREHCVFSRHNALADPPFLRMDFLSCRNMLIYLEPILQQKIVPLFHYALKQGGWLWLGSSESAGSVRDLFDATDVRHKIYTRRAGGRTPSTRLQPAFSSLTLHEPMHARQPLQTALPRDAERLLLAKYAPPGVVVSGALEIVQFQGDTGPYLAPAAGAASLHLIKMLREGLPTAVRDAVQKVDQTGSSVRVENLRVRSNSGFRRLAVEVIPLKPGAAGKGAGYIVLFDEVGGNESAQPGEKAWWKKLWRSVSPTSAKTASTEWQAEEIAHLTEELATARETMQATLEQHEAATEELQSANEEAQSANEEMQSIYEELENSKAEIEARNKELTALTDELASRNAELNRVNDELRKSEHLYRAIGESINYGVWICSADGRNTYASESFLKLVGMTQEQCSNMGWGEVLHPDDTEATMAAWLECVRTGQSWYREHRVRGVDGQWNYVLAHGVPVRDDKGQILNWAGINLDIRRIKESEAATRLSEQRFRNAVSIMSSLVWTNSAEGRMEGDQPAWGAFTGQTQEEYQGYGWAKAVHPDDAQPTVDAWQKAVAQKGVFEFEHRVRRADGQWRLCSIRAKPTIDDDGNILEWVGVHTDITEKREFEKALREREALFSKLVEQAPGGMHVLDENLCMVQMNSMSRPVFANAEPVIGRHFSEVMEICWGPEEGPRLTAIFQHTLDTGERFHSAAYTGLREDLGVEQTFEWETQRIVLPNGRYGVVCYFKDVTEQHALETALRASEQRAKQIVQSITDGFMTVDDGWRITYLSPRGAEILEPLEKTADNVVGQDFWKEFPDTVGTEMENKLRFAKDEQTPVFFETFYAPLKQWFDIRAYPSPAGLTLYFLNITERKEATDALRKSEAFKRSIIESSPDCVKVLDLNGTLLSLEAGHSLLGVTDGTPIIGLAWIDFWVRPEDHAAAKAAVENAASGRESQFTGFFRTLHGHDKWWNVAITPILSQDGRPVSLLAVSRDVTESRKMEDALRASESRKDAILSSALDAIITMDHEGRLVEFNQAAERIFGYARTEVLGKQLADLIIPEGLRERHRQGLARYLATGDGPVLNKQIELPALRSDGTEFPAEFAIIPIPGTQPPMFTAFLRDITQRRQMEDSLVARADQLAQADRSKDEFLAMLAHELRNPLAPLRNATELLKDATLGEDERTHAQSIIGRQIENMSRMLDDLLDVSRITEGKIEMRKKPVALGSIITAALSHVRTSCATQKQELSVSLPKEPLYLEADATRLEQIFGNLLTNASKYSGEGSHISIHAERAPDSEPPEVIVSVRDDGIGIDPELLPRIFDLFVQASRTLDRSHGGLGIGLTLVQRLVKLHGGHIEAHSQGQGQGAEFIIRLPLLREPPPEPPQPQLTRSEAPRRILIVDDNTDSARTLAVLQSRRGHETQTAFTGPDALTVAKDFKPEIVLLDIGLPGMDGFEVARQIRALPGMKDTLLIAMSGYGSMDDRTNAQAAGFDDYFVKPIDLNALRARLGQFSKEPGSGI